MIKSPAVCILVAVLCSVSVLCSDGAAAADVSGEYWCYGDSLHLSYGSDMATVTWKLVDGNGKVLGTGEGPDVCFDIPSDCYKVFVTQTASTGYGSAEARITVNMMHFGDRSVTVSFYSERNGTPVSVQVFDAYKVCMNGVFLDLPDDPEPVSDDVEFGGWYTESGDAEIRITEDYFIGNDTPDSVNVYAKWLRSNTLILISEGSFYQSIDFIEGMEPEIPKPTDPSGKTFAGWYLDSKYSVPLDSYSELSDGQVLYAKWVEDEGEELFNPVLLLPLGAVIILLAYSHMRRQKSKGKSRRYL